MARRLIPLLVAAALLATAGCSSDGTPPTSSRFDSYVALGDSYVAGPGIDPIDRASGGCQRSKANWPALLAKSLHVGTFHDVSCGGATTEDIVKARSVATALQPHAQIDAVTTETDLVTLGIGGNDENLFGAVIYCAFDATARSPLCTQLADDNLEGILERTTTRITAALERIRAKAPAARIILVGYLRVLPEPGGCDVPGLSSAQASPAVADQDAIDMALADAAKRADVEYISMSKASVGHESCTGSKAWVNGLAPKTGDGAFLHPTAAGMRAVAKIVSKHLTNQD